jgi:hypothetical protein
MGSPLPGRQGWSDTDRFSPFSSRANDRSTGFSAVGWRIAGEVRGQALTGGQEFSLIDDVVPVKHGAGLVAGEEHRHAFGHTGTNQIASRRPPAVVKYTMCHVGATAGVPQGCSPRADRHVVAVEHSSVCGSPSRITSREDILQRRGNRQDTAGFRL